jgi:hypothetical protein
MTLDDENYSIGSDLREPVPEHVDAALVPTDEPYPPPLDQLLRIGHPPEEGESDVQVGALGLAQSDVPNLVRMARDRALNNAPADSDEAWAPIQALLALKPLDVAPVVGELIPLLDVDDDWFKEELPDLLASAGEAALEPLTGYLHDRARWIYGRTGAGEAIAKIGAQRPELRGRAIRILGDELEHAAENDAGLNGFLIADLLDLDATEALPAIRQAFEQDAVDETVAGDWGEVQRGLGQNPDRNDPLVRRSRQRWDEQRARLRAMLPESMREPDPYARAAKPAGNKAAKRKHKRKQAAASRKANKRKRK